MVTVHEVVEKVGSVALLIDAVDVGDISVSGALVNEHSDPSPWLEGGEILMTDGMGIDDSRAEQRRFVRRLIDARVSALALGVGPGLRYQEVPEPLRQACRSAGLPLIRVPETTPFIRITDAVYSMILSTRATDAERTAEAQSRLVQAAARPGSSPDVIAALTRLTGLWAQLRDSATSDVIAGKLPEWISTDQVQLTVDQIRPRELRGTAVIPSDHGHARVQAVGAERLRGYLLYGTDDGKIGQDSAALATFASSLLAIDLERRAAVEQAQRKPRSDAAKRLLGSPLSAAAARRILSSFGVEATRLYVATVSRPPDSHQLLATANRFLGEALGTEDGDDVVLIIPETAPDHRHRLEELTRSSAVGLSGAFPPHELRMAHRQATQAVAVALRGGGGLVDAMAIGNSSLLLQLGGAPALRAYAEAVLNPILIPTSGPDRHLLSTLIAWFDSGCNLEAAASSLGVHRHTVRNRLQRVEVVMDRRLDVMRDRFEVWLALESLLVATSLEA
ncbi:PucR family transcriptional regulator [Nocardioides sp.]|uniref:PucR family transcriptional regulator n=1 Tax=Nocardioides sp. TaxID=35761 RepID=UPI003784A25B